MDDTPDVLRESSRSPDALDSFLVEHARKRAEPLAELLVETIERDNPGYRATHVVPHADLLLSCQENVARVLDLLRVAVRDEGLGLPDDDPAYDAARQTGRRRAEQGLPLDDVLRSFRMGGRLIWDDLVVEAGTVLDARMLPLIGTWVWQVVDETSAQVAAAYHAVARDIVRADDQFRAELWEGVLGGRAREAGFAREAAHVLDLPPQADVVVVVAASLDVARADLALAPHATAWTRRTADVVGLVALRDDVPDEAVTALDRVGVALRTSIGVSSVRRGLAEVHEGYGQASFALRAQGRVPGAASFDDRLPEALLLASPDVADRLVERWLGPILDLAEGERRALLDTLVAWVASGGSATRTATLVHCHRNTVVNRLRRVGDLIGRRLADDAVPLELDLALRVRQLGD